MSRTTIAQLEAHVAAQANDILIAHEAITALSHQLARLEQQVALLQLADKAQPTTESDLSALPIEELEKMDLRGHPAVLAVQNWGMEYVAFREFTGRAPFANGVRAWVVGKRPRTKIAA